MNPFLVDSQKHERVRVTFLVIHAPKLLHVDRVCVSLHTEDASNLRMNRSNVDCLLHALKSHAKEEDSSDL